VTNKSELIDEVCEEGIPTMYRGVVWQILVPD
jgi:hypothetical protein